MQQFGSKRGGGFDFDVHSLIPGRALAAACRIDIGAHVFLRHTTVGDRLSRTDPELAGLPVFPLAMAAELIAQAAALLAPGEPVASLRDVLTHGAIEVDEGRPAELWIEALRDAGGAVRVRVGRAPAARHSPPPPIVGEAPDKEPGRLLAEGTVAFGAPAATPDAEPPDPRAVERPLALDNERLYRDVLFRGPALRTLQSAELHGDDRITGELAVPAGCGLFQPPPLRGLMIAPALVDGALQLPVVWASERPAERPRVEPAGFDALWFFAAPPADPARCGCRARVADAGNGEILADVRVARPDGRPLLALERVRYRRSGCSRALLRFAHAPCESFLSAAWPELQSVAAPFRFHVRRCTETAGAGVLPVLGRLILSRAERPVWDALPGREKRHRDWLLGRLAAKDAVRCLAAESREVSLCPADVAIESGGHNQPVVGASSPAGTGIRVSIAHWRDGAAAVAAEGAGLRGAGIDVESLDRGGERLETIILTEPERGLLPRGPAGARNEWLMRFWCAKEAVAKAVGRGLMGSPFNLVVRGAGDQDGSVRLTLAGGLARAVGDELGEFFIAWTGCDTSVAFAVAFV